MYRIPAKIWKNTTRNPAPAGGASLKGGGEGSDLVASVTRHEEHGKIRHREHVSWLKSNRLEGRKGGYSR